MTNHSDHDAQREKLWCDVYSATANSANSLDEKACENMADQAVAAYDERFSPEMHAKRVDDRKIEQQKQRDKEKKKALKTKPKKQ